MFPTLTPATTLMAFVLLYTSQVVEAVPALGAPLVPRQTTDCAKDPPATFVTQNAKDAQDMNVHFKLINKDEQCKDGETACIDKQLAHCESSKWILTPCAPELSCYALPLFDKSGTDIECKAPKSAASIFEQACMENGPYGDLVAREEECDDPNNSGNGNGNNDPNNPGNGNGNDDPNNPGNGNGNEDPNNGNGNDDSNDPNNPNNDNGNGDNYGIGDGPGNQPSNGPDGNQNDENSNGNPNNGDGSSSSTMPVPSYGPDSSDMPSSGPNCDTPTMTITMTITMNPSPTMSMNRGMPTPNMARRAGSGLVSIMPEVTPFTSSTQSSLSTGVISFSQ